MQWLALYILLCGVGYLVLPWMLRAVKGVQPTHFGLYDVPPLQEREYDGPPKLAHEGDFTCDECGHGKFVVRDYLPHHRECVRCRHRKLHDPGLRTQSEVVNLTDYVGVSP